MATELKSIQGVEIFSVGTWNGDSYTQADLDNMVEAFNDTKGSMIPALKLGHNKEQKALFQDGLPAAGWVGGLYTKGERLLADFIDLPSRIAELLEKKAYRKVSSEIFWDIEFNGKVYHRMLAAVALLGAQVPAVNNLNDILALYGISAGDSDKNKHFPSSKSGLMLKTYDHEELIEGAAMPKTEAEIKLELELKAEQDKASGLSEKVKNYEKSAKEKSDEMVAKDKELEEARAYKKAAEAKEVEAAKKLADAEFEKGITELESSKLITPAMKPYVKALLGAEQKEYSLKKGEKEEKFSKVDLLKQILKLHSKVSGVNFSEGSEDSKKEGSKTEKALNAEIEKFMAEKKVSYSVAYREVMKTHSQESEETSED